MIYLDNSATTKPNAACVQAMTRLLCDTWGNPSSVHELGIAAERELKNARKEVAASLGAEPDRVFFTSGGTEADNWAIFSDLRAPEKARQSHRHHCRRASRRAAPHAKRSKRRASRSHICSRMKQASSLPTRSKLPFARIRFSFPS